MLRGRFAPAIKGVNPELVWKKEPRYDTFVTAAAGAGVPLVPFFAVPKGQVGSGFAVNKTVSETNLSVAGMIGSPNQFLVHGFAIEPVFPSEEIAVPGTNTAMADYLAIYFSGLFRFTLDTNNIQLEIPVSRIPAGPGANGILATALAGVPLTAATPHNGVSHISHYYDFRTNDGDPVLLDGSQSFRVELVYAGGAGNLITATAMRIRCYMYGLYGSEK